MLVGIGAVKGWGEGGSEVAGLGVGDGRGGRLGDVVVKIVVVWTRAELPGKNNRGRRT